MAATADFTDADEGEPPLLPRERLKEDTEMDITPMIDCVFLLLIFFTVTSTPDAQTALDLAPARHGGGVSEREAIIISVAMTGETTPAAIYLADGKQGEPLSGSVAEQEDKIRQAVEEGLAEGKVDVLIKAERGVLHRDVSRVASAAGNVNPDRIKLSLAVMEVD